MLHALSGVLRWSRATPEGQTDQQDPARIRNIRSAKSRDFTGVRRHVAVPVVQRRLGHREGHRGFVRIAPLQEEEQEKKGGQAERRNDGTGGKVE